METLMISFVRFALSRRLHIYRHCAASTLSVARRDSFFTAGPSRSFRLACVSLLAIASLVPHAAVAQWTAAEERGLPTNAAFSGSDIDTVNLQNGNLHINIPILKSKQRGGAVLTWSLVFDTQTWIKQAYKYVYPDC
jgi:hypothetical protein